MQSNTMSERELLSVLKRLPEHKQQEVLDFALFLFQRTVSQVDRKDKDRNRNNFPDPLRRFPNLRKDDGTETLRRFGNLRKGDASILGKLFRL